MAMTKEQRNAYAKEYYRTHRKEILAKRKQYYNEHREERTEYQKEYIKDPTRYQHKLEYNKRYRKSPKMKQWRRSYNKEYYAKHYSKKARAESTNGEISDTEFAMFADDFCSYGETEGGQE